MAEQADGLAGPGQFGAVAPVLATASRADGNIYPLKQDVAGNLYVTMSGASVTLPVSAAGANNTVTVGTTAQLILAAAAGRLSLLIQNLGAADIYIGNSNAVTTGNGVKVPASGGVFAVNQMDGTAPLAWYGISGSAGNDVRYITG